MWLNNFVSLKMGKYLNTNNKFLGYWKWRLNTNNEFFSRWPNENKTCVKWFLKVEMMFTHTSSIIINDVLKVEMMMFTHKSSIIINGFLWGPLWEINVNKVLFCVSRYNKIVFSFAIVWRRSFVDMVLKLT